MLNEPAERGTRRRHSVHIDSREKATVTGVEELDSFNEEEIVLLTEMGLLSIIGEGMHIDRLNLDEGQLIISGFLYSLEYEEDAGSSGGLFSRLLKR